MFLELTDSALTRPGLPVPDSLNSVGPERQTSCHEAFASLSPVVDVLVSKGEATLAAVWSFGPVCIVTSIYR